MVKVPSTPHKNMKEDWDFEIWVRMNVALIQFIYFPDGLDISLDYLIPVVHS